MTRRLPVAALLACLVTSCSVVLDSKIHGSGIGVTCSINEECHAGYCDDGICTTSCAADPDCPSPSRCFSNKCQLPLTVAALWLGVAAPGEGWTLAHQQGMQGAAERLPYMSFTSWENVNAGEIPSAVASFVRAGAQVIIGNSDVQRDPLFAAAPSSPQVKFLSCQGFRTNDTNAGSYGGHLEQAWFVAGKVAAAKADHRIGIIGSFITPETVRYINAFTLGVRTLHPQIVVEVSWIGFWADYNTSPTYDYKGDRLYREELLAARLIESGCEVVAHLANNQRSVRYIDRYMSVPRTPAVWSLSNDNRYAFQTVMPDGSNGAPMPSCLGGTYWNWTPLYTRLLDQIHRGTYDPATIVNDPLTTDADALFGFQVSPAAQIDDSSVRSYLNDAATAGPSRVFRGPYDVTGQRDKDKDGVADTTQAVGPDEVLSEDEYERMCWFVQGVVEKTDPLNPASADRPAKVPDSKVVPTDPPSDALSPPGAPPGTGLSCHDNL